MLTTTTIARELFEQAGADGDATTNLHPHRAICEAVIIERDGLEFTGHTIAVSPDTIDLDSHEAFEPGERVTIRRTNAKLAEGDAAVVMHCTGTIIGYTIGIAMQ